MGLRQAVDDVEEVPEDAGDGAGPAAAVVPVDVDGVLTAESDVEVDFLPWSRKSVTYQPEPFSAKPAAVTCLTSFGCPHSGQSTKGGSESF